MMGAPSPCCGRTPEEEGAEALFASPLIAMGPLRGGARAVRRAGRKRPSQSGRRGRSARIRIGTRTRRLGRGHRRRRATRRGRRPCRTLRSTSGRDACGTGSGSISSSSSRSLPPRGGTPFVRRPSQESAAADPCQNQTAPFSSECGRASATSEPNAAFFGSPPQTDPQFRFHNGTIWSAERAETVASSCRHNPIRIVSPPVEARRARAIACGAPVRRGRSCVSSNF